MGSRESRPPEELLEEIDELRASRTRVVLSADTARRRIERELHDSTLQHLVALAVNLQYLGQLLETNVSAASALLKELRRDVHDAVDSLRELAHRVYPPLLLDRGLSDALRAAVLASRFRRGWRPTGSNATLPSSRRPCTSRASMP